jgi:CheY-like chemotaxis protein
MLRLMLRSLCAAGLSADVAQACKRRKQEGRHVVREVLVVDDEADIRGAVRMLLEDARHAITEAADGGAALAHLQAASEGLIVPLDVRMPGMEGITVLEAVAAEDYGLIRRHAFVLMTAREGRTMPLPLPAWLQDLRVPVLAKPFNVDDLLAVVQYAASRLTGFD